MTSNMISDEQNREFTICGEAARRRSLKTRIFVRTVSGLWSQRNSQRHCRSYHVLRETWEPIVIFGAVHLNSTILQQSHL